MRRALLISLVALLAAGVLEAQNNLGYFTGGRARVVDGVVFNPAANPSAYQISGTAITVEGWVFPTNLTPTVYGQGILRRPTVFGSYDTTDAFALYVTFVNGFPQAAFSVSDGTPGAVVLDPDTLKEFQWTHLAGTYDGSNLSIYANGVLKAQEPAGLSISGTGMGLYVGRSASDFFYGLLDDVRLWNVTRTGTEIISSKDIVLTGSEPGLAGYWKLDTTFTSPDGVDVTPDDSPNKNDLAILSLSIVPFIPADSSMPVHALITPTSFDFGTDRNQGDVIAVATTIENTSSIPLFGTFTSSSAGIAVSSGDVYVPAMTTSEIAFNVRIMAAGTTTGTITFDGNIPSPIDFPFTVQAYALPTIDANNVFMWLSNTGGFARNGTTMGAGLEWPKGSGKTAVFASGIWIAATVSGATRTAVAEYSSEFAAGPIVGGVPADPTDRRYRVYKISKGDNASNPDYAEWPIDLGAPVNPDSTPAVFGDQTLFSVYNDITTHNKFYTAPLGAEVQQTTFAFDQPGALGNTVFLRFKIINKSADVWQNTYLALWSDPDVGNYLNDLVGIDTLRTLGFAYNGTPTDPDAGTTLGYGPTPPAVGYDILKGAFFTKEIQAFARYASGLSYPEFDPAAGHPEEGYNFMKGLRADGSPFIDPTTSMPTTFPVSGDPVTGTGWVDTPPADRRFLFSTGPFDLEPGQSKEMIAAIIVAQGTDYLNSITELRDASDQIQALYDGGQVFGGAIQSVVSTSVAENDSTTLDDLASSGAQFDVWGGTGGATVEAASYIEAPPGASSITTPSVAGVGKYIDFQVQGTIQWPVSIRIYYTANDLNQAGVTEGDLTGIYYWNGTSSQWILYSNSGADDQGRGPSTTGVNTTNVTINGVNYEGYVYASAFHLTPIAIGAKKSSVEGLYNSAIDLLQSLPPNAFKKPHFLLKRALVWNLQLSYRFHKKGHDRAAAALICGVLHRIEGFGKKQKNSWITDEDAREQLIDMLQSLLHSLMPSGSADIAEQFEEVESEASLDVPHELTLSQNYPNPFNPATELSFTVPEDGKATIQVYNMLGEEVAVLFDRNVSAGERYRVTFDGSSLPSGLYFARLDFSGTHLTRKMLLVK